MVIVPAIGIVQRQDVAFPVCSVFGLFIAHIVMPCFDFHARS
jgi:hypothetical protein